MWITSIKRDCFEWSSYHRNRSYNSKVERGLIFRKKQHKNKNKISLQGFCKEILTISRGSRKDVFYCFVFFRDTSQLTSLFFFTPVVCFWGIKYFSFLVFVWKELLSSIIPKHFQKIYSFICFTSSQCYF